MSNNSTSNLGCFLCIEFTKKKRKKLNQVKNLIEIDLEIRSCKFGITKTTTQSRNSQCNCKKLLTRQDLIFFLVKNPMKHGNEELFDFNSRPNEVL